MSANKQRQRESAPGEPLAEDVETQSDIDEGLKDATLEKLAVSFILTYVGDSVIT